MEYPHWMMIAGGILVLIGFIGFAIRKSQNAQPHQELPADEPMASLDSREDQDRRPNRPNWNGK